MKIFIATDINIVISRGRIYANQKHSTILKRYSKVFGKIVLCTRFRVADNKTEMYEDITYIIDSIVEVQSLYRMFLNKLNAKIETAMKDCTLVICRCPAISAFKAADVARKLDKPYLTESMGDPWDAYWNHGIQGKLIAPYMFFKMKNVVKHANYAVYVTSKFLQGKYPCNNESIAASNVLIDSGKREILNERNNKLDKFDSENITLMTTAAIDVRYKGQQYVIQAIPKLNRQGIRVKYYIVGEGKEDHLYQVAQSCGVVDQVVFTGKLPLNAVLKLLDETDIYLQPSLQEGLPRSVIEAMSRGCACIGARTAGIPELLQEDMIVRRKSVEDIVNSIQRYVSLSIEDKKKISLRNWTEAELYSKDVLDARRDWYFSKIKNEILN